MNMLKMARTGVDRIANTSDDYTVDLVNVGNCSNTHEIKVTMAVLPFETLGACGGKAVDYSFDPGDPDQARHFSVVFQDPGGELIVELNSTRNWDYAIPLFANSFESGDTSGWSMTVP